ncbi:M16 family metallopeptidase [Pseudoflavonifractor phocaeensis]|uniref:M16 family metallopeptidase n=1 Tax=Pseudoflavonifractor phocaeensis TaxID=1870988 RepID=UPI00195702F0|nr:pitrilysin family protein [Pseudoflavonifractor phocaeensis]MBM6926805.1 insulinase family protein [Pseudoflavonifractor phocaeensis]
MEYQKLTLPNGVRVLTEQVPGVRSAALGIWVGTGSRHEKPGENGAAHFIEHMLFKGTQTRSAAQLAAEMDAIGGQVNAFTTKECTCFYARVLDSHLPQAADILCDMFFHSKFDDSDVDTERGVILEEIGMYEDNPEDLCAERLAGAVFKGSPLARPILGRQPILESMNGPWLKEYMRTHYGPRRVVVTLAGRFTQKDVDDLTARFSHLEPQPPLKTRPAAYRPGITVKKKAIEQNHLTLAFPGLSFSDPRRFTLQLLSSVLGGGMSSRLFQQVRERRGLCYSIYSYGTCHDDTGYFGVYTALGKETEGQALDTILAVIREVTDHGVTQEELDRAREQSKANVLMGLESTQAHMSSLGRGELMVGRVLDEEEIIAAYDAVTREDVRVLAGELLDLSHASLSAVGRVGKAEDYQRLLH